MSPAQNHSMYAARSSHCILAWIFLYFFFIFLAPHRFHPPLAYNGTKLVLSSGRHTLGWITVVEQQDQVVFTAGGEQIGPTTTVKEEIEYFRDVYVIDQETSVWTRLANGPFRYTNFVAAVAGDHLVLYGSHAGLIRVRQMCGYDYSTKMAVLDLKENVWVDQFTPSQIAQLWSSNRQFALIYTGYIFSSQQGGVFVLFEIQSLV